MIQLERTDREPYYPEDDMTAEQYQAYCEEWEDMVGEYDEWQDRKRKERMEDMI